MGAFGFVIGCFVLLAIVIVVKGAVVVPQQTRYVIERLGQTTALSMRDSMY